MVSLQAGSAGSAALELGLGMAVRTAGASYWRWFLGQLVIGAVSTGYLAEMGWDAAKQREWLNEAKKETPIRLNHYASSEKKALIDVEPRHIRPNKSGFAFFTPDVYESSAEATNMLATPREQEWFISLNMYEKLDKLSPKSRVEGRWWDPPEAESHVWRDGGGWERTTPEIIILNKIRQPSPWQPLSD